MYESVSNLERPRNTYADSELLQAKAEKMRAEYIKDVLGGTFQTLAAAGGRLARSVVTGLRSIYDALVALKAGWTQRLQYAETRRVLLQCSEQQLTDIGIDRGLLESGVRAWPWTTESYAPLALAEVQMHRERTAVAELRAYSDAELHDSGIRRAGIVDAVRFGRAGIDEATKVDQAA